MMEKPDVDTIEGLSPAISIEQKSTSHNPRSTVGTITEIYDYLRLLYARAARRAARTTTSRWKRNVSQMVDLVLAPGRQQADAAGAGDPRAQGRAPAVFDELRAQGFVRAGSTASSTSSTSCPSWTNRRSTASMWWWTASRSAPTCSSAWPNRSRPRSSWRTASPWWRRWTTNRAKR
jgi:excinuclease UvrABC ATPase subunit